MKKEQAIKAILIIAIVATVLVVVFNQLFKIMGIDLTAYKQFKYNAKSKTPKSDWYNWVEPLAREAGAKYGVPWQAIMVQTALETGWGKSTLATKYNNFGGVKYAGSGAPSKVNMSTGEVFDGNSVTIKADFAAWPSPYEGMHGYANFFHRNGRYATALKYPNDPYKFIEEIKKAGYATGTNYVATLHGMLKNDLKITQA